MKQRLDDYREGVVGALLDEHDKAIDEFTQLLKPLSQDEYVLIVDEKTDNDDCRSIMTICSHMIRSGYDYANLIRRTHDVQQTANIPTLIDEIELVTKELNKMMIYMEETVKLFEKFWNDPWDLPVKTSLIDVNMELLLEHSVVHILRHRRQVEKFILTLQIN